MRKTPKPKSKYEDLVGEWYTPSTGSEGFKSVFKNNNNSYVLRELAKKSDKMSDIGAKALVIASVIWVLVVTWTINNAV